MLHIFQLYLRASSRLICEAARVHKGLMTLSCVYQLPFMLCIYIYHQQKPEIARFKGRTGTKDYHPLTCLNNWVCFQTRDMRWSLKVMRLGSTATSSLTDDNLS